eukprot:6090426-Pyramimonas_sp.AAC.1
MERASPKNNGNSRSGDRYHTAARVSHCCAHKGMPPLPLWHINSPDHDTATSVVAFKATLPRPMGGLRGQPDDKVLRDADLRHEAALQHVL